MSPIGYRPVDGAVFTDGGETGDRRQNRQAFLAEKDLLVTCLQTAALIWCFKASYSFLKN